MNYILDKSLNFQPFWKLIQQFLEQQSIRQSQSCAPAYEEQTLKKSVFSYLHVHLMLISFQKAVQTIQRTQLMFEAKLMNLFKESTEMYCEGNYQACLALLSDCLTLQTDRSILYSNRAIVSFHLKQLEKSFEDLHKALRVNHLNYIAYFNLFSLHFLNGNHAQAFKNICLCLSTAYTNLSRFEPNLQWIEQSLYYSFNNKESLFLKAILVYKKSQLRASLQLFRQVLGMQVHHKNREGLIQHIHSIEGQLGLQKTSFHEGTQENQIYTLRTNLACPQPSNFQSELTHLLKQFNEVYRLINDEMQMQHEFKENSISSLSEGKSDVIDKEINRATTYHSTAYSREMEAQDQRSTMMLMSNHKQLKLLSAIDDHLAEFQSKTQTKAVAAEDNLYPLRRINQKVKFFIEKAQLNLSLDDEKEKIDNIYVILRYKQNGKVFQHRSSIVQNNQNSLNWGEWTDDLMLASLQNELEVKILNKKYTSFKDDLLAEGHIEISKSGCLSIPLFHKQECNGSLLLTVEAS